MNHRELLEAEIKKFDYNNGKIRLTLGVLVVAVLCAFLITSSAFFGAKVLPVPENACFFRHRDRRTNSSTPMRTAFAIFS